MIRPLSLFFCYFFIYNAICQVNFYDKVDVSSFPIIDFKLNNRNPDILEKSSFVFTEFQEDNLVDSELLEVIPLNDSINYESDNKCVLILFEFIRHDSRNEQNLTFVTALNDVLSEVVNKGDKFMIATFALKYPDGTILKKVNNEFTDDVDVLRTSLNKHNVPISDFNKSPLGAVSDIYDAIVEGVGVLDEFDSSLPKSIFVLSEEINNGKITNLSALATNIAKEKAIVVNSIKYNKHKNYQHSISSLVEKTYGIHKVLGVDLKQNSSVNIQKKQETVNFIKEILNNVVKRSKGIDYTISLKLRNQIKNGKTYKIRAKIDDSDKTYELSYRAPGNWIYAQFQHNLLLSSIISVIILFILMFVVNFLIKRQKNKKQIVENRFKKHKEVEEMQSAEILSQKQELDQIKQQEKERVNLENKKKLQKQEELLISEMLSSGSGSFPILKYVDSNQKISKFSINKPIITVGREKTSNSIVINNKNISRNHFKIVFNNNEYKIFDNNSTNGILLNGKKINSGTLNNSDIIQIADIRFTFFK